MSFQEKSTWVILLTMVLILLMIFARQQAKAERDA